MDNDFKPILVKCGDSWVNIHTAMSVNAQDSERVTIIDAQGTDHEVGQFNNEDAFHSFLLRISNPIDPTDLLRLVGPTADG